MSGKLAPSKPAPAIKSRARVCGSKERRGTRPRSPKAPPVAERVDLIVQSMAEQRWVAGDSVGLAERWGLSVGAVDVHAAEASRRLASLVDKDKVREMTSESLAHALHAGRGRPRDVAAVAQVYARIVGAEAPAKVEMSLDSSPQWAALCEIVRDLLEVAPAERRAEFRQRLEQLAGVPKA